MSARAFAVAQAVAVGLLASGRPAAAQRGGAGPAAGSSFERVLWVPAERAADAEHLARVRDAGFSAINLGPAGDAGPVGTAGLGIYLDQPIGKGFLELRDRDWEPLLRAYERTRDGASLLRPQCLRDRELWIDLGVRAAAATARMRDSIDGASGPGSPGLGPSRPAGAGLRFVALADEASSTRHNNPLDVCRCANCIAAFRAFVQRRHRSIEALNAAWGTDFAEFGQVEPLTTDQVRRRELGGVVLPANLQPFGDWLEFVDEGFAAAVQHVCLQVQRAVPDVPVGLTGLQPPMAFGGNDYARLLPGLSLVEPYDLGAAPELARSFAPRAEHWFTLTLPTAVEPQFETLATARLCEAAARGDAGVVVWNDAAVFADGGELSPMGKALRRAFARMQQPLDACCGASPQTADVWLCESQASVRAWWMLDSAADGLTWVRRLASYEAQNSTSLAARRGWVRLLSDLGINAQFVAERDLPVRLLQQRPRLLVLPAQIALGERCCSAIAAYVRQGGAVLADHSTALYDDALQLRAGGGLDAVFGIEQRSLRWQDLCVREGRLPAGTAVAETGLVARMSERAGREPVFVEHRHGRGRAVYLNLAVCDYARLRLDPAAVDAAVDLRRRVRQVLKAALVEPPCDVRGDRLPTCLQRTELRCRDGRVVLCVRIAALDAPPLLQQLAQSGPRPVQLVFPRPVQLRTLAGDDRGSGTGFDLLLDAAAGLFVELRR